MWDASGLSPACGTPCTGSQSLLFFHDVGQPLAHAAEAPSYRTPNPCFLVWRGVASGSSAAGRPPCTDCQTLLLCTSSHGRAFLLPSKNPFPQVWVSPCWPSACRAPCTACQSLFVMVWGSLGFCSNPEAPLYRLPFPFLVTLPFIDFPLSLGALRVHSFLPRAASHPFLRTPSA